MKYVKSFDGTKIAYYKQSGDKNKPTLVFLHGVGGNYTTWNKELEFFKKKNYSCIAVDLRGHGASDAPDDFNKYVIENFAKDIEAVIKKEKLEHFSLIGHSLGGGISSTYNMVCNPKAKSVALIEPSIIYPFEHDHLLNHGSFATKMLRHIAYNKHLKKKYFPHFKEIDLSFEGVKEKVQMVKLLLQITPIRSIVFTLDQGEKYFKRSSKDIKKFFKNFDHPTLVITAENDDVCKPENAKEIANLGKDHSEFYFMRHADHMAIIDNAQEVNQVLFAFFEREVA